MLKPLWAGRYQKPNTRSHSVKLTWLVMRSQEYECTASILFLSLTHNIPDSCCFLVSVNKQINDKERIAAAMENPNLKKIVEECISDEY